MVNLVNVDTNNFDNNYAVLRASLGKVGSGHDPLNGICRIFDEECSELSIDVNLLKRLNTYQTNFVNRDQDSIEFFGGNLTGVQVVRFLQSDRDRWFDEIVEVNDGPLGERLVSLPDVNSDWFISSDTMNLSCAWLAHKIYTSPKLTDSQKHSGMINIFLILQYKYLTSILFHWFRYPADKATAEATYAQLTYRYAIKQYGSWSALLHARAEEIVSKTGIHHKTIAEMKIDTDVVYMLNDIQGRIKDIMKNIYSVFERVRNSGARIVTTSSVMVDHEGEEILKDKTKHLHAYSRYINSIISDKNTFVKSELTDVIENLMHTMPSKLFLTTLNWMSDNYRQPGAGEIETTLNGMIIYTFSFISENKELIRKESDLAILLSKLKGSLMSSRSTEEELFKLRNDSDKIVRVATGNKNESVIAATRTGILLYIVARTLTMKHYQ